MPATITRGKVWKFGDNISTDFMMPGFAMSGSAKERASYCMRANRPEFAQKVQPGDVIVGGRNFGCGSSRPAAVNLRILGVGCVIAESFGRIFFRNSINLGFPVLDCPGVLDAFSEGDVLEADFEAAVVRNLTTGQVLKARVLPEIAQRILETGGIMALLRAEYAKPATG